MAILLGTSNISDIFLGTHKISQIYLGTDLLYTSYVAPSVLFDGLSTPIIGANDWAGLTKTSGTGTSTVTLQSGALQLTNSYITTNYKAQSGSYYDTDNAYQYLLVESRKSNIPLSIVPITYLPTLYIPNDSTHLIITATRTSSYDTRLCGGFIAKTATALYGTASDWNDTTKGYLWKQTTSIDKNTTMNFTIEIPSALKGNNNYKLFLGSIKTETNASYVGSFRIKKVMFGNATTVSPSQALERYAAST